MIELSDVVFVMHHGSIMSRTFGWFMGSKWSHSALVADVGNIGVYLHETSDTQTKVGMLALYVKTFDDEIEVVRLPLTQEQKVMAVNVAAEYHNKMYGYLRLLGAALRCVLRKLGWKTCPMLFPWGGPLCMMIPHAGIAAVMPCPKVGSIDTEDFYQWCKTNGKVISYKKRGSYALSVA